MENAKKQQTDGDEHRPEAAAEHGAERGLGEVVLAQRLRHRAGIAVRERAVRRVERGDDDERVEGQHHEGVDEHADHGDDALLMRRLDVRSVAKVWPSHCSILLQIAEKSNSITRIAPFCPNERIIAKRS